MIYTTSRSYEGILQIRPNDKKVLDYVYHEIDKAGNVFITKETVKKLTMMLKKSYPSVYNTLIKERNEIMAKNLYNLMNFGKIVAVVGAGHEDEIIGLIEKNVQHDKKRSD